MMPASPRRRGSCCFPRAVAVLLMLAQPVFVPLQAADAPEPLAAASAALDSVERGLKAGTDSLGTVSDWGREVVGAREFAQQCIAEQEKRLTALQKDLESLGRVARGEPLEVTRKRATLLQEKGQVENALSVCRLMLLRSDELQKRIGDTQRELVAQRLLARGPNIVSLFRGDWEAASAVTRTQGFLVEHSGLQQISPATGAALAALSLAMLLFGVLARRRIATFTQARRWDESFSHRFLLAVLQTAARYAPQLLLSVTLAAFFYWLTRGIRPVPFVSVLVYGLPVYFFLVAIIHLFLSRLVPGERLGALPVAVSKALWRRLKVMMLLILVGYLLFATILAQSLPEPVLLLARGVFVPILVLNLLWTLWLLGRVPALKRVSWLRWALHLALVGIVIAEWTGYRNLSFIALRAVFGSVLVIGLALLLSRLLRELFDGLQRGRRFWHRRLRHALSVKRNESVPGIGWLRVITLVLLWASTALVLLHIWGLPTSVLDSINSYLLEGFTLGLLTVVPARILLAVATLAVLIGISGWVRRRLEHGWLVNTRMDRGAREAMVTVSGYAGVAIAVIVALGVAGVQFSNMAIIVGALSVGIGFGLQNIVNNFVSGLILLFERPIKTGDWIVTGGTEGYVKRIRIRSTQIQTFDRADVIVPNSELISAQVTNWMLYDASGRVRVPVSVAYGSDTAKVRDLLLGVAAEHPLVVHDVDDLAPTVLFLAFGDSSLDFELRCFIHNIDKRLRVLSDMNFAIDAAFRANGIEIPFPQRDLHVRDWAPRGGRAADDDGPTDA